MRTDQNPPLLNTCRNIINHKPSDHNPTLPLIDLHLLRSNEQQSRNHCKQNLVKAAQEWGFFQVINHNIPDSIMQIMRLSMPDIFRLSLKEKNEEFIGYQSNCHSSGMFNKSESFHIPLSYTITHKNHNIRYAIEEYARYMMKLAQELCTILEEDLEYNGQYVNECCKFETSYLRLNHYLPCKVRDGADVAMIPHTDSDFLTVVFQNEVGGLEMKKGEKWVPIKPNPEALIINIGDLFQARSNGLYKSVEHRVMSNSKERFSIVYFLCPPCDTVIRSHKQPSVYREFTFKEFREQTKEDVKLTGNKVGLPRFLKA